MTPEWEHQVDLDCDLFIGRTHELDDLSELIVQGPAGPITVVRGVGGIGKTATTFEAVKGAAGQVYSVIAWASFRPNIGASEVADETSVRRSTRDVLRSITTQLGLIIDTRDHVILDNFTTALRKLGLKETVLIIIDNLERLADIDAVVDVFTQAGLTNSCHLVLTTRALRTDTKNQLRAIQLGGLTLSESCNLIRHEASSCAEILSATDHELNGIHTATEGNPYLLKLLSRRLVFDARPLRILLVDLARAAGNGDPSSLSARVQNYMFRSSMEQLIEFAGRTNAETLLHAFGVEPPASKVAYDTLQTYSGLDDSEFQAALSSAHELSLVTAHNLTGTYSIHSLLHHWITP